ncbi:MAG: hypothetical protein PUB39_01045 [Eubacteriales bacterium]|nr:hypothetical protein [Eubacteriales bacterium]
MREFIRAIGKEFSIKKVILMVLMTACMLFICSQYQSFLSDHLFIGDTLVSKHNVSEERISELEENPTLAKGYDEKYYAGVVPTYKKLSMKGNVEIRQTFIAKENHLDTVYIYMENPEGYRGTGKLTVSVLDDKGRRSEIRYLWM